MKKFLNEIFNFLSIREKIYFFLLQILVILSAILESTSIFSVGFFFSSLMISNFQLPNILNEYLDFETMSDTKQIKLLGVFTLISFSLTLIIAFLNNLFLVTFTENLSRKLKNKFFSFYLDQNLLYHKKNSSNKLIKNLIIDLDRVSSGLILPFLRINSKIVILSLILMTLVILKPLVTTSLILIFFTIYFIIIFSLRKFLAFFGKLVSLINEERVRIIQESINSIKDVLLSKSKMYFVYPFENLNYKFFKYNIFYTASNIVPRTLIDLLSFSSLIIIILIINEESSSSINILLNTLILIGFGAYRILPILQDIYNSVLQIKGSRYVIDLVRDDLTLINLKFKNKINYKNKIITNSIFIDSIKFSYKATDKFILNVKKTKLLIGESTAIIGRSGSGKSTLVELMLGLIQGKNVKIFYDKTRLNKKYFENHRHNISYVSQKPFILNDNIISNILMVDSHELDQNKLKNDTFLIQIIKNLDLNFLIKPNGKIDINKRFGEDGSMISGGQKQRVAIARAIYKKNQILVLDEATSSLDSVTENKILNYIYKLDFIKTTIYVTHKVQNVKHFNQILYLDDGKLIDKGSYNYLKRKYLNFRKLIEINKN